MTGNMGSNNGIKGFIAEGSFHGVGDKDADLFLTRAGIPAERSCVGGKINRCDRTARMDEGCSGFSIAATEFKDP